METLLIYPETVVDYIVLTLLGFAFLSQIFYYLFFFRRVGNKRDLAVSNELPPLSIIVCAKNEEANLRNFLPEILNQDYPNFEVVVVNDCSQDDTEIVLSKFKAEYPHLYYTSIPYDKIFVHGKKLPLTVGVKAAKNEHLVFIDADCRPVDNQWLKRLVKGFTDGKEIVLAHGAYERRAGFLNRLIRYDTFLIATQYLGFALAKVPYMGVGRNMAFKKSLFNKIGGYKNHVNILSGDDDLFVAEAATKSNVAVIKNRDARTLSVPVDRWSYFVNQKQRHLTTSPYYKFSIKMLLGFEVFTRLLFYAGVIYSVVLPNFVVVTASLILIRTIIKLIVFNKAAKVLGEGSVYWSSLYLDIILPFLYGAFLIDNRFRKRAKAWK